MKKLIASTVFAVGLLALAAPAAAADCGDVSIAEMNWSSAGVAAHVDRLILENGYGCNVTIVPGDTVSIFTSMTEAASPDIAPEIWVNALRGALNDAIANGRLVQAAQILSDGGIEGWWIPRFIAEEHPDIRTVQDALKRPELFPAPGGTGKGLIHNCPDGWNCQISTKNLYRALGGESTGFDLAPAISAPELDNSIRRAFESRTGWLGYYWAPNALLGTYQMVRLSFGVDHDKSEWIACTSVEDCPAPKLNSYPTSDVFTVVTREFSEKGGAAMDYVRTRRWGNATVGAVLAWMEDDKATNEDAARYFLKEYADIWTAWVTPDAAEKIKAAL